MSPEVFQSQKFGEASDVWAFGVTLVELYSQAATPYGEWSNILVVERVKDGYVLPRPADCPVAIYDAVIAPCFLEEPRERPPFQALCTRLGMMGVPSMHGGTLMVPSESTLTSPPAMQPSQPTGGGGGRVDRPAAAKPLASANGRAVVTDGASFGFAGWGEDSIGVDTPQAAVAVQRSTSPPDAGSGQSGDSQSNTEPDEFTNRPIGVAGSDRDGIQPHRGGNAPKLIPGPNRHRYRPMASMGMTNPMTEQLLYAVPPPDSCRRPTSTAAVTIERTEALEDGMSVTTLEAQMLRALLHVDDDASHDHILKVRRLTDAQLSEVVELDGVPWLATEVDLLRGLPEDCRPAFRTCARDRVKRLPNAELAWAEPHPEPKFVKPRQVGNPGAVSRHSSADAERVYGAAALEDMPRLCASTKRQPDGTVGAGFDVPPVYLLPGSMASQPPHGVPSMHGGYDRFIEPHHRA